MASAFKPYRRVLEGTSRAVADYVSVQEAAALMGVDRRTVWRLIVNGDLEAIRNPFDRRAKLVRREDVDVLAELARSTKRGRPRKDERS